MMFVLVYIFCATCHKRAEATGICRIKEDKLSVSVDVTPPESWEMGAAETAFFCPDCKTKPVRTSGQREMVGPNPATLAAQAQ